MSLDNYQFISQKQHFEEVNIRKLSADEIYVNKLSALSANFINLFLEVIKLSSLDLLSLSTVFLTAREGVFFRALSAPNIFSTNFNTEVINADFGYFNVLTAQNSFLYDLTSTNLSVVNLNVDNFATGELRVPRLSTVDARINSLSVQNLTANYLTAGDYFAFNGYVENLTAKNLITDTFDLSSLIIPYISATEIDVVSLSGNVANINTINAPVQYLSAGIDLFDVIDRPLGNVLYVSMSGDDNNSGRLPIRSLRTIKKACEIAHNDRITSQGANPNLLSRYTINVLAGDYTEINPIYIPQHVSIIGDNLRRCTVRPLYRDQDIFWVDNSAYVWGFTFRSHFSPGAAIAFPNLTNPRLSAIAYSNLNVPAGGFKRPFITTSPYIQGSSSITQGVSSTLQSLSTQQFNFGLTTGTLISAELNSYFNTVTDIILKGTGSVNLFTGANTTGSSDAISLLDLNNEYIKEETLAFVNSQYPGLLTLQQQNLCKRDVGLILSAIKIDLGVGSNAKSIEAGEAYWTGMTSVLSQGTVYPTIQSIQYAQRLANFVINNETVPTLQAGCGMRVDGTKAEGFLRSMVLDSFTQFNENGKGIHILNNGYAQLVSIFTICTTEGIIVETGGVCSISNSNCSFGLSGIVARGKSLQPVLTGTVEGFALFGEETPGTTRTLRIKNIEGLEFFPDSNYYPQIFNQTGLDTRKIAYTPYNGLVFTLDGDDSTIYTIDNNPVLSSNDEFIVDSVDRLNISELTPGRIAKFYIRSTAYASSHTFEFVGSGVILRESVPALGGVSKPEDEVVFENGGAVYYTSTNQTGDFSVGEDFRIVSSTGTIEGRTFQRAILTLVTPLTLALE